MSDSLPLEGVFWRSLHPMWKHAKLHVPALPKNLASDPDGKGGRGAWLWGSIGLQTMVFSFTYHLRIWWRLGMSVSILYLFAELYLESSFFAFTELQFFLSISKYLKENGYTLYLTVIYPNPKFRFSSIQYPFLQSKLKYTKSLYFRDFIWWILGLSIVLERRQNNSRQRMTRMEVAKRL